MSHSEAGSHPLHQEAGSSIYLSPRCPPSLTDCEVPSSAPGEASRATGCLTLENPEIPLTFSAGLYENREEYLPLCLFQLLAPQSSRQPRAQTTNCLLSYMPGYPSTCGPYPVVLGRLGHLFSTEESAQTGAAGGELYTLCYDIMVFHIAFCKRFCFKGQYGWVSASS